MVNTPVRRDVQLFSNVKECLMVTTMAACEGGLACCWDSAFLGCDDASDQRLVELSNKAHPWPKRNHSSPSQHTHPTILGPSVAV